MLLFDLSLFVKSCCSRRHPFVGSFSLESSLTNTLRFFRGNQSFKQSATIRSVTSGLVALSNSIPTNTTSTCVLTVPDFTANSTSKIRKSEFDKNTEIKTTGSLKELQTSSSSCGSNDNATPPEPCMLKRWKSRDGDKDKFRLRDEEGYRIRAAALCLKGVGQEAKVLLVSGGKDGAKWVVPGGGVEKDECAEEAAHRELMEEAGVRASTLRNIGVFEDPVRKHRTQVFVMEVSEELQHWEENEYGRQRIWMPLIECAEKVKQSHRPMIEALLAR